MFSFVLLFSVFSSLVQHLFSSQPASFDDSFLYITSVLLIERIFNEHSIPCLFSTFFGFYESTLPQYPTITYYWTVPLILDHSYLVGKLRSSKIAGTKVSGL
jgi:hypothetical protein